MWQIRRSSSNLLFQWAWILLLHLNTHISGSCFENATILIHKRHILAVFTSWHYSPNRFYTTLPTISMMKLIQEFNNVDTSWYQITTVQWFEKIPYISNLVESGITFIRYARTTVNDHNNWDRCDRDRMVVWFTTIYAVSFNHLQKLWVRIPLMTIYSIQHYVINVWQWLAAGWWFSHGTPVSTTNTIDRHNIAKVLLKVDLNTIALTHNNWLTVIDIACNT